MNMPPSSTRTDLLGLLNHPAALVSLAMAMWVVTEAVGGAIFRGSSPLPQVVWLRYAFHLAVMLVLFGVADRFRFIRTHRPVLHLGRSLCMLVMPLCFAFAAQTQSARSVFGVFWVAPLLVLLMARLLGMSAPRVVWLATLVATLGAIFVYRPPIIGMGWAAVFAVGMAASFSAYIVLTRELDRTEPILTNLFYSALGVFLALSVGAPLYWEPLGARQLVGGAALAISGLVGLWLLELGIRRDTPARLAPFLFTQVVVEELLRVADRRAMPSPYVLVGLGLIGMAALVLRYTAKRTNVVAV